VACARLLTDRLSTQLWCSALFSLAIGVTGYALASLLPVRLGLTWALSAAGMMATLGGVALGLTILLAPRYGIIARRVAHARLAAHIAREDLLAQLFRAEETGSPAAGYHPRAAAKLLARGEAEHAPRGLRLTDTGRAAALDVVRRHRLWESYLVSEAGMQPDHVHPAAERLEHLADSEIKNQLAERSTPIDPHGKAIPPG
jgi:manganese/zinc/iron transport system permease protein